MKMWIARDCNGEVFLHTERPRLFTSGVWHSNDWFMLAKTDFPQVTFENSPMEVELVIKK